MIQIYLEEAYGASQSDYLLLCMFELSFYFFFSFFPRFSLARPNRPNQRPAPSQTPNHEMDPPPGLVPRPGDLPYLIVGIVLGAFVFIIVAFIPFCLWRAWAKQSEFFFQLFKSLQELLY